MFSILLWSYLLANLVCGEASASFSNQSKRSIADNPLQCYSLPYGALGFVGHIITLYTFICLWGRRRPSNPWRQLGNHPRWVRFIGIITLVVTLTFAIFAIAQCSDKNGSLVLNGLLNASVSLLLGCTACVVAPCISEPDPSSPSSGDTPPPESQTSDIESNSISEKLVSSVVSSVWPTEKSPIQSPDGVESQTTSQQPKTQPANRFTVWIALYLPFSIGGLVGSATLVNRNWDSHSVQLVTVAAVSVVVCCALFMIAAAFFANDPSKKRPQVSVAILACFVMGVMPFSPFYSDWVLGAIAGDFAGLPITKSAAYFIVYWGYFVANLFPLVCI